MEHRHFVDGLAEAYAIYADEHALSAQQGLDLCDAIDETIQCYAYDRMEHPDVINDLEED